MFLKLQTKFDPELSDLNIMEFGVIPKIAYIMHEIPDFHLFSWIKEPRLWIKLKVNYMGVLFNLKSITEIRHIVRACSGVC